VKDVPEHDNTDDLKKELASLRLDHEPPRSRRGAWVVIALLVFMVAAGTIFWWGRGVFAATEVETATPRVERAAGAPSGTPLLTTSCSLWHAPAAPSDPARGAIGARLLFIRPELHRNIVD
jgi:hypothetical protein